MTSPSVIPLPERVAVRVSGDDRISFLQGLLSNDVRRVGPTRAIYAALLTPQGKYLHDVFVIADGDALILDCERARADDLCQRLSRYRLRAQVALAVVAPPPFVGAVIEEAGIAALGLAGAPAGTASPFAGGIAYVDPRLAAAGVRLLLPAEGAAASLAAAGFGLAAVDAYDRHRLALGLADGSRDITPEKDVLLECGFDELNGIDWHKGCYMGQEVTARTKYRGLVKRRLVPVESEDGEAPPPGTPIFSGDREVGEVRSGRGRRALALLRLEAIAAAGSAPLSAGGRRLKAVPPPWLALP